MTTSTIWAPKGEQGAPGPQGPVGPVGPVGPAGGPGPDSATFLAYKSDLANQTDPAKGNALVGYLAGGINAGGTTVQNKMRDTVSVMDFLRFYGDLPSYTHAQTEAAFSACWNHCLLTGKNLYMPAFAGGYEQGEFSFPWRQSIPSGLLDCKNITIFGDGPATVLRTSSTGGADALQLNGVKNLHFRNFQVETVRLAGPSLVGSNGCSVTYGFDNITMIGVRFVNLATIDNTPALNPGNPHLDGGKALSFQIDSPGAECGSFYFDIEAVGCAQGFGFEDGILNLLNKKVSIIGKVRAENCFAAISVGAAAPAGVTAANIHTGVKVEFTAVNCQKDVIATRIPEISIKGTVVTTKTAAQRRLNPGGITWQSTDLLVEALWGVYIKGATIEITGNKGECDYFARIGSASAGASGQTTATDNATIRLDLAGTPSIAPILEMNANGIAVTNSTLWMSALMNTDWPANFYAAGNSNTCSVGTTRREVNLSVSGTFKLKLTANGTYEAAHIKLYGGVAVGFQGRMSSTPGDLIFGMFDINDFQIMGWHAGGGISFNNNLPVYADNTAAAAAGLPVGRIYRTSLGAVMMRV